MATEDSGVATGLQTYLFKGRLPLKLNEKYWWSEQNLQKWDILAGRIFVNNFAWASNVQILLDQITSCLSSWAGQEGGLE